MIFHCFSKPIARSTTLLFDCSSYVSASVSFYNHGLISNHSPGSPNTVTQYLELDPILKSAGRQLEQNPATNISPPISAIAH